MAVAQASRANESDAHRLSWLHISDFHLRADNSYDRQVVLASLSGWIRRQRAQGAVRPDLIFATGDIAFSGKAEEYAQATHFFDEVLDAASLTKSELFVIPGNHDVERAAAGGLERTLDSEEESDQYFAPGSPKYHFAKLRAFYDWHSKYFGSGESLPTSTCAFPRLLSIRGNALGILEINSSLFCADDHDHGKLWIGRRCLEEALTAAKPESADVWLALIHHPLEWLHHAEGAKIWSKLAQRVDLILRGHLHETDARAIVTDKHGVEILAAGACYEGARFPKRAMAVSMDLRSAMLEILPIRYEGEVHEQWTLDAAIFPDNDAFGFKGRVPLKLKRARASQDVGGNAGQPFEAAYPASTPQPAVQTPGVGGGVADYDTNKWVFLVPHAPKGDRVIGRRAAIERVRQQLVRGQPTAIGQTAAFHGLGGLGKTQLAVEYSHEFKAEYPNGVIWINADQEIDAQLTRIAVDARWIAPESKHQEKLDIALNRLRTFSGCLIVFDNVEEVGALQRYLPTRDARPHLLITSRTPQPGFEPVPLDPLSPEESVQLLLQEARRTADGDERDAAIEIAKRLDGLPLAIEIAGAYLHYLPSVSLLEYRGLLDVRPQSALTGQYFVSFTGHDADLDAALSVSQQLLNREPLLHPVMEVLAWSGSAPIGRALLAALLNTNDDALVGPLALGVALRLITVEEEDGVAAHLRGYRLHRLVREVWRARNPLAMKSEWVTTECERIGDWFEQRREDFGKLLEYEREIDHLAAWQRNAATYAPAHASRLLWLQAYPPFHRGRFRESLELVESAIRLLPPTREHDLLSGQLNTDLSTLYSQLGAPRRALDSQVRALEICRSAAGERSREVGLAMNNLGSIYSALGDYRKALDFHLQSLQTRTQVVGDRDASTAASLNNVGTTYVELGDAKKALEYQTRALQILRGVLGERHPETASVLDSIGLSYSELGDVRRGLGYQLDAYSIRREVLGDKHPATAVSLMNVGASYARLGDYTRAQEFQLKGYEIRREVLGDEHVATASALNNLGSTYRDLGQYRTALECHTKALEIRRAVLGERHPATAASLNNVGSTFRQLGEYRRALEYHDQAVPILRDVLGERHPAMVTMLGLLGTAHGAIGDAGRELDFQHRALARILHRRELM